MTKHFVYINSIESMTTYDGEGLRSAIFLQGCPLRCVYCHNPETHKIGGGEKVEVGELVKRVMRFSSYWTPDGGVTLSGGEPLLQSEGALALVKALKTKGVNVALDTSGVVFDDAAKKIVQLCDHVILDLKFNSEAKYKNLASGSLHAVLQFLDFLKKENKKTWVRIVVVPGINDSEKEMAKYLKLLAGCKFIEKIELLGFHTLGFSKYEQMRINNPLKNTPALSQEVLARLQKFVDDNA